jgi:D-alanyl-lipoteichoic acid acyltransferase DltB (MBOAT superfamily)
MVFTSFSFLIFLAATTLIYYIVPMRQYRDKLPSGKRINTSRHTTSLHPRGFVLLLASLVFYCFAGWEKLPFVLGTALLAWLCSRKISNLDEELEHGLANASNKEAEALLKYTHHDSRRRTLVLSIVLVLVIYFYCKYLPDLFAAISGILTGYGHGPISFWKVIVPLGLSYYTLSIIGYLLDVYWHKQKHEQNFLLFLLCVLYFPQILQGPISRYREMRKEFLNESPFSSERLAHGVQLMLWGFFKKLVIADRLNLFVSGVVGSYPAYEGLIFWLTALMSTFQLYADFSGCMDIAAGVSEIFGIQIAKNFDHPFSSRSVAEWWRRWHITLCAWMRDYVFYPMTVSPRLNRRMKNIRRRRGPKAAQTYRTIITLAVVWLLTGLWHDIRLHYLIWGLYYAILLIVDTVLQPKKLTAKLGIDSSSNAWQRFQMVRTTLIFSFGRLITVPGDFRISLSIFRSMFTHFNPWVFWDGTLFTAGLDPSGFLLSLLLIALLLVVEHVQVKNGPLRDRIARMRLPVRWIIWYAALAGILILGIYGAAYDASTFAYMNF